MYITSHHTTRPILQAPYRNMIFALCSCFLSFSLSFLVWCGVMRWVAAFFISPPRSIWSCPLQEHLVGDGREDTKHEMARHFELCDSDGDGYLTFSQFLHWVELCDLNPEDHLQVGALPCRAVLCHAMLKIETRAWEKE